MNKIKRLWVIFWLLPSAGFAHPGTHQEHAWWSIVGHFLSEPDHLLMISGAVALLLIATKTEVVQKYIRLREKPR